MPPFNSILWSPRISNIGDDYYNIKGGTKLDGSKDSSVQLEARLNGNYVSFSSPPTIPQINASSHINQIIGYYNYRASLLSLSSYPYQTTIRTNASFISSLQTAINALRVAEGNTTFTFSNVTVSHLPVLAKHYAELRKALGTQIQIFSSFHNIYRRSDTTYGSTTGATETLSDPTTPVGGGFFTVNLGQNVYGKAIGSTPQAIRTRNLVSFVIPSGLIAIKADLFYFYEIGGETESLENCHIAVYSSNTDDSSAVLGSGFNGSAYNLDNLENSNLRTTFGSSSLDPSRITAKSGSNYSLIFGQALEMTNSGLSAPSFRASDFIFDHSVAFEGMALLTLTA